MISLVKRGAGPVLEEERRMIVEKIPPPHRFALSHILRHIQRIHDYFRGTDKISSLFAAFGTILVRPPLQSVRFVKQVLDWKLF